MIARMLLSGAVGVASAGSVAYNYVHDQAVTIDAQKAKIAHYEAREKILHSDVSALVASVAQLDKDVGSDRDGK